MTMYSLDSTVSTIRELQAQIDELTAQIDSMKDTIKAAMIEAGSDELTGTGWKATWKPVTSTRLDTAALKKALPEVYQTYSKASTATRFCIA